MSADSHDERIFAVAIKRDGKIWGGGQNSHWQLRFLMGDGNPVKRKPRDIEGFIVSPSGRFVDRVEAHAIAWHSGQTSSPYRTSAPGDRELLSSEVTW